jgi:hypothetical protein
MSCFAFVSKKNIYVLLWFCRQENEFVAYCAFAVKKTNLCHALVLSARKQICVMLCFCQQETTLLRTLLLLARNFVLSLFAFVGNETNLCCTSVLLARN